jgi:hypothetical protein
MKNTILVSICISFVIMVGAFADDSKSSAPSPTSGEYSRCVNSDETKFMIQVYKQQYKSISNSQIAHILCSK